VAMLLINIGKLKWFVNTKRINKKLLKLFLNNTWYYQHCFTVGINEQGSSVVSTGLYFDNDSNY